MAMDIEQERAQRDDSTYWRTRYDDERRRLAMLWKAFEDAEARISDLERALEAARSGVSRAALPAPAARPPQVIEVLRTPPEEGLHMEPRYPVGIYKMAKVPGVTKGDVETLSAYGVNLTDQLLHTDLDKLAEASGISREKLQRWHNISELMAINGIGATWAMKLVDADVLTIPQLSRLTPDELTETLMKSYQRQGANEEQMLLFRRTLPARSKRLIEAAKKAAKVL